MIQLQMLLLSFLRYSPLLIFLWVGIHCTTHAQQIPFFQADIQADGKLDEKVWKQIAPFQNFQNFFPINEGAAHNDTDVYVFHNGTYLNIAFVYHDSSSRVRVNSLKRDDYSSGFHLSDGVGIVIDPYSNQNRGYLFALNGKGAQLDALIANFEDANLSWDAIWQGGAAVEGTDKVYEFHIPLTAISYDQHISSWSFQFYTRDARQRMYTVWNKFPRGFFQYDTRFLKKLDIAQLQPSKSAKAMVIPSLTASYAEDNIEGDETTTLQPSLDLQYKLTDGLRIDATLNPDFSQVDVDQQVTNLTRFSIAFPERRNFFIENSDMFTTLQLATNINPFFSRFIGASEDILLGVKLSGNLAPTTRIGVLNVQSKENEQGNTQNYTVAAIKQQFGPVFNATAYLVNRQARGDYNRVIGAKANYLSNNRKWSGFAGISQSLSDQITGDNHAFTLENNYNTRTLSFSTKVNQVGRNYLTDIGFVPRLNNYDALNDEVIREGYSQFSQSVLLNVFPKDQSVIQSYRPVFAETNVFWDEDNKHLETNYFYNMAVFFANQMSAYVNFYHDEVNLKYAFDPLRNGNLVLAAAYQNTAVRMGFNSDYTQKIYGSVNFQSGSFYQGNRNRFETKMGYRFLPLLALEANYEYNNISLENGEGRPLHLLGITTELFFSNKLNWTTYLQYNQQIDNININSRLQWEYKPLSFIYLVYTDNYTEELSQKNWAISLKITRRLHF
ncbi:MAG: DUF5916 domain-containing protein [Bacteroidota bacterium]